MNIKAANNISLENATVSSQVLPSKAEGIALCTGFILSFVFIVVGNLLTIVLFAANRSLRKRGLFLVINMAFADLMLGTLTLPLYIYRVGKSFQLWNGGWSMPMSFFYVIVDTFFSQASLISEAFVPGERFYAIYWPLKHRTLSMRAYSIIIFTVWVLTLLITALWGTTYFLISYKHAVYVWTPYILILIFIICGCNVGIWRKFRQGNIASQQQNRDLLNKRLTKTLLFVSFLTLLSCLSLVIFNCVYVYDVQIPWKFYDLVNFINYSNSFANPGVYALRIPEFRETLVSCCLRRPNMVNITRRRKRTFTVVPAMELGTLRTDSSQLAFQQKSMDRKVWILNFRNSILMM